MRSAPRISNSEFARRRVELMQLMEPNSIAILPASQSKNRNGDVEYSFRQDSDFYYLSGFGETDSVFVLVPGREHGESILFCRERDEEFERWNGPLSGPDRARQLYGIADAFPIEDIDEILPGMIEGKDKLYYAMGVNRDFDNKIIEWVNSISSKKKYGAEPPGEFVQLGQFLHELRLFKSKQEITLLKQAANITTKAHIAAMRRAAAGVYEYQLEAELQYLFLKEGARSPAYPIIVGSGQNSCILHYIGNAEMLQDGDLVLVDAGCEYQYYACDATRTFPVNGCYNAQQKAIYEIVLAAQKAAIEMVRPGNNWNQPHQAAVRVVCEGLVELGLLRGEIEELIETEAFKQFYMHKTGHWMGMDVHDVGEYKIGGEWRIFEAGMVLTVEPGIYISKDVKRVPKEIRSQVPEPVPARWRGLGIRIEDNLLVTRDGNEVLTRGIPKEIDEIEHLLSTA
ncbi:MAG: aminopeptidase P N-terminal domain-containing protein [Pseudomonadales bacterium]|nr:aminopeptidase P N-terminal domain-containing protein [Pseudomonadales bacterium]MDP7145142.1 aminopeptidase P N-terminal domain-containing protein [Pseudomonadales bacterium]MDP7359038.1 aminopeptidase P N-terminal domain-containing protein [Pseudomonadales bacterium]HJN52167.1 aminopeptidase P N-terminal domain-containing protein [Pseudomonadales bacterium]